VEENSTKYSGSMDVYFIKGRKYRKSNVEKGSEQTEKATNII